MHADLTTRYLGLTLRNPLVVSACHLTSHAKMLQRLEQEGAAAAVLPSLFEEQITHSDAALESTRAVSYVSELDDYDAGPDFHLRRIEVAKQAVSIPIIASLNGCSPGGWVRYARRMQDAGADAVELNLYFVSTKAEETSQMVESRYLELVGSVRELITIPLAVKIGPYFSSLPNVARHLVDAGANGLVLFDRYLQPDIDLESLQLTSRLTLSSREEVWLPIRWIALLRGQVQCSLAATSGIHVAQDVLRVLFAGADVAMMASTLIRHGPAWLQTMLDELQRWMDSHAYSSLEQMRGRVAQTYRADQTRLERANYMQADRLSSQQ